MTFIMPFLDLAVPISIIWIGYHGYIIEDIDPAYGSFADTSCVSRGKQLMDLTTKYRYMLDQFMSTVNASGSHSRGQDLILCAYERCGLELRPKDVKLFNFYMIVRSQDLAFCGAMHPFRPTKPMIRICGFVGRNGCIALQ